MATDELPRRTHVAAQVKSVGRRETVENIAAEERPLPPFVSKVLAKLKAAGTAEKVIVQLEESERKLQSLKSDHSRSDRIRHSARPKYNCKASTGQRSGRHPSSKSAWPREDELQHVANQKSSSSKPPIEHCVRQCGGNQVDSVEGHGHEFRQSVSQNSRIKLTNEHYLARCETEEDMDGQSSDEFEAPCTSIADSALTKSMRLLDELRFLDLSEDVREMEPGNDDERPRADSCLSEQNVAEQLPSKPIALIEERIALLIELLQQPNQEQSSQRNAVIDELRSVIHEHTRSRSKTSIDKLSSRTERLQSFGSNTASQSASTRTPSRDASVEDFVAHCPEFSRGGSTSLSVSEGGAVRDDGIISTPLDRLPQGRAAACSPSIVRSLFVRPSDSPQVFVSTPNSARTASCPPSSLSASPGGLKAARLAHSPRHFSPRRLVCTNVKVTRTWKYE